MKNSRFTYDILATVDTLGSLVDIPMHEIYLDPEAGIESFMKGKPLLEDLCGDIPLQIPYTTPVIKYGHLHELGLPLQFPKGGQVAPSHMELSLSEVESLIRSAPFSQGNEFGKEQTKNQIHYLKRMRDAFPSRVYWGWQWEGPLTSLWALMGSDFFLSFYDEPEKTKEVLLLMAQSICDYIHLYSKIDGVYPVDPFPDHGRLCDDLAAMLSPALWPEFVNPSWDLCLSKALLSRKIHCEGMVKEHLPNLRTIPISNFDPGISPQLNPLLLQEYLPDIPFSWRLGSFHYAEMTNHDVEQFVFQAAYQGAYNVFTVFEPIMCDSVTIQKVHSFANAAEKAVAVTKNTMNLVERQLALRPYIDEQWNWNNWKGYASFQ